ncbi:tetratricopeptide repeat protein 17-like isoform X2 [Orussus abietinus]|uniref:tetratricopeptide repeat protein 17-like isoform X2 n=1 Tax=Orussus abietinus TaxID=222816 RepID=UPI000626B50D|nr:tetratricopeptide repeat protein 17-like isoform X2 [Orussus abietinus]
MRPYTRIASYALWFLVLQVELTNSGSSWRLSADKVVKATEFVPSLEEDPIFDILANSVNLGNGQGWSKSAVPNENGMLQIYCNECNGFMPGNFDRGLSERFAHVANREYDDVLDCGKPVNFTYYDNLIGVANRNKHPLVPEPNVALIFKKKGAKGIVDVDINSLEKRLKKAKREKPKSVQLYNQIGNFWRIKGNAQRSIECFRRALAVSPHNAEVLLNLARVLLILQYLDDATYLARRSLELLPPERDAWEQFLTLGQIFKAYGHFQEAAIHLRHALELKPDLTDAAEALKEVESLPVASIHVYTLLIIVCLVLGVLLVILSSGECEEDSNPNGDQMQRPVQRHFNRAMAMRSLRLNVSRNKRC